MTLEQKASIIKSTSVIGGQTQTKRAFEGAKSQAWDAVLSDAGRERVVVHITDGESSAGQEPCDVILEYQNAGISVLNVMVGDAVATECSDNSDIRRVNVPNLADAPMVLKEIYDGELATNCEEDLYTPFN